MITRTSSRTGNCQLCKFLCNKEFMPVITLKCSGLLIYLHETYTLGSQCTNSLGGNKGSLILCNSGNKKLNRYDYIAELCQYRTKCYKCRILLQHIRNLIDNVSIIKENEVIGVCEHCKRSKDRNKCKRCEYVVSKFINSEVQNYINREKKYKEKLLSGKHLLRTLLKEGNVCKHNVSIILKSKDYDNLSNNFIVPLISEEVDSNISLQGQICPKTSNLCHLGNTILPKIVSKLSNIHGSSKSISSDSKSMCICKYAAECKQVRLNSAKDKEESNLNKFADDTHNIRRSNTYKLCKDKKLLNTEIVKQHPSPAVLLKDKQKSHQEIKKESEIRKNKEKNKVISHKKERNRYSDFDILKNGNERQKKKLRNRKIIHDQNVYKVQDATKTEDLLFVEHFGDITKSGVVSESESILECNDTPYLQNNEIIKGSRTVLKNCPFNKQKSKTHPLLFKIQNNCSSLPRVIKDAVEEFPIYSSTDNKRNNRKDRGNPGVIRYKLSDTEFIDKGWTQMPTIKLMKKMNIYKMIPHSKFDWFKYHKEQNLYYETHEKFASTYENGCGKWFYKNGNIALDYFSNEDMNEGKRCVIYNCGNRDASSKKMSMLTLACFDYFGNGIVYDNWGKVRLKYNQSEGVIIDKSISPPHKWKWHTLDEPPLIRQLFIDTYEKDEDERDEYLNITVNNSNKTNKLEAIESENLIKQKAMKLNQDYKPFQIKIKTMKINDFFSLRIIDQANIYVDFRYGRTFHRLHMGMFLISDEIIGAITVEFSEVATPYDQNVYKISSLTKTKKCGTDPSEVKLYECKTD